MIRIHQSWLALVVMLGGLTTAGALDSYEYDDVPARASPFLVGSNQVHTFHSSADEDWVRFLVAPGGVVDIEVEQLGGNVDVQLEVYHQSFNGAVSNVTFLAVDDEGKGARTTEFTAVDLVREPDLPFGFYLLRVFSADTNCFGAGADYSIQIFEPIGPTFLAVIALDTQGGGIPPSDAVAIIDGQDAYPFGAANTVTIPNLSVGVHSVEVRTSPGYAITFDPDAPGQELNPHNPLFGNPRLVTIADGAVPFLPFAFYPVVSVKGRVLDAHTGEGISGVPLSFQGTVAPVSGLVVTQQYHGAWYGSPWHTKADGSFPEDVFLEKGQYALKLDAPGHVSHVISNSIVALIPGTTNQQGNIMLAPIDANTNGIADAWEQLHFSGSVLPGLDGDNDGAPNRDEYLAGTDPTNRQSVFSFEPLAIPGTNAICLAWPAVKDRIYSVESAFSASDTNRTVLLDRWVAPSNGVHRFYDQGSLTRSSRVYRVRIDLP